MIVRLAPFNPDGSFVAARPMVFNGTKYDAGDVIDVSGALPRRVKMLYEFRQIKARPFTEEAMNPTPEEVHQPPPVRPPLSLKRTK